MNTVKVLGQEFPYNPFKPDDVKRLDTAKEALAARVRMDNGIPELDAEDANGIYTFCEATLDFFDAAFGKGAAKRIFGDEVDALVCLDAYIGMWESMQDAADARAEEVATRHAKYSATRIMKKRKKG